jgi:hypothetical protein
MVWVCPTFMQRGLQFLQRARTMTYRNDRDAAFARSEALQQDLRRAEAERDQLRAEVRRLEREPRRARIVDPEAPTPHDVARLMRAIGRGFREARDRADAVKLAAVIFLVAGAPTYLANLVLAGVLFVIGALGVAVAPVMAVGDDMDVLETLRSYPREVIKLIETRSGIIVVTKTARARCLTQERESLLVQLAKHCPNARVTLA